MAASRATMPPAALLMSRIPGRARRAGPRREALLRRVPAAFDGRRRGLRVRARRLGRARAGNLAPRQAQLGVRYEF